MALDRSPRAAAAPAEGAMFVEGVRLFVVVLGTAAGFALAKDLAFAAEGVGAMVGCLAGYVAGGVLGRLLHRALGAVERRVDDVPPARVVAGALGAIAGASVAVVFVLPIALLLPTRIAVPIAGLVAWVAGWLGLRVLGDKSVAVL